MGITDLVDIAKTVYESSPPLIQQAMLKRVDLLRLANYTILIDASMLFFRHGTVMKAVNTTNDPSLSKQHLQDMSAMALKGFLRLLINIQSAGAVPIVVFDQRDPKLDIPGILKYSTQMLGMEEGDKIKGLDVATILQSKTDTKLKRIDASKKTEARSGADQYRVTKYLVETCVESCKALNVEYHLPLEEADWRLAAMARLLSADRPVVVLTDDTDLILYPLGKAKLLRAYSIQQRVRMQKTMYEMFDPIVFWHQLGIDELPRRAVLGATLGCDYSPRINLLGVKKAFNLLVLNPGQFGTNTVNESKARTLIREAAKAVPEGKRYKFDDLTIKTQIALSNLAKVAFTSPKCFDGMSQKEIENIKFPFHIPAEAAIHFVTTFYTQKPVGDKKTQYLTAIKILEYGHRIEETYILNKEKIERCAHDERHFGKVTTNFIHIYLGGDDEDDPEDEGEEVSSSSDEMVISTPYASTLTIHPEQETNRASTTPTPTSITSTPTSITSTPTPTTLVTPTTSPPDAKVDLLDRDPSWKGKEVIDKLDDTSTLVVDTMPVPVGKSLDSKKEGGAKIVIEDDEDDEDDENGGDPTQEEDKELPPPENMKELLKCLKEEFCTHIPSLVELYSRLGVDITEAVEHDDTNDQYVSDLRGHEFEVGGDEEGVVETATDE